MTYLVPDDWYANHNLAPGDARLPQKPMQPERSFSASKGLAPTPPMRGQFGHFLRPLPPENVPGAGTVSPFAVPDGLWQQGVMSYNDARDAGMLDGPVEVQVIHRPGYALRSVGRRVAADLTAAEIMALSGLGGLGDDIQLTALFERIAADMKKQIIAQTIASVAASAAMTVVVLSLNVIPIIGQIINLAWAALQAVFAIARAKYKRETEQVMQNLSFELQDMGTSYVRKLEAIQSQVFEQEKGAAIQLALSGEPLPEPAAPVNGLSGDWWKKVINPVTHIKEVVKYTVKPLQDAGRLIQKIGPSATDKLVQRPLDQIAKGQSKIDDVEEHMESEFDKATGKELLNIARDGAARARITARKQIEEQYNLAVANTLSPAFREQMRINIARNIRENPAVAQMITDIRSTQAQANVANLIATGQISPQQVQQAANEMAQGVPSVPTSKAAAIMPAVGAIAAVLLVGALNK